MSFIARGFSSESHDAYGCYISFHLKQFLSYLDFHDLGTSEDYRIAILKSRMSLKLGLPCFLTIQFRLYIFDRIITKVVFHPIRWYTISFCLTTNDFHFDLFIKVIPVKILCYKVTFPFVINKCFMRRYFEMMWTFQLSLGFQFIYLFISVWTSDSHFTEWVKICHHYYCCTNCPTFGQWEPLKGGFCVFFDVFPFFSPFLTF